MTVLTVTSSKGGPGKTTLCQVLPGSLAGKMRVAVIDADPTQAVSRWAANAYEGPELDETAEADETRLAHLIAAKVDTADLALVDTAGFGNRAATIAITSADAVLIPSLAGEADVTEAEKTIRLVEALVRAARRDPGPGDPEPGEEDRPCPPCCGRAGSREGSPPEGSSRGPRCLWGDDLQREAAHHSRRGG
jgi:chromosome partitioning protein